MRRRSRMNIRDEYSADEIPPYFVVVVVVVVGPSWVVVWSAANAKTSRNIMMMMLLYCIVFWPCYHNLPFFSPFAI